MIKRFLTLVTLLAVTGCQKLPEKEWNDLQRVRADIRRGSLERYLVGPEAKDFESTFEKIRRDYAVQANRNAFLRKTRDLNARIAEQLRRGNRLKTDALTAKERLRQLERDALASLETEAENWSEETLIPGHRQAITAIQLDIKQAQTLWAHEEYLRVQELLERIEEQATAFQQRLEGLQQRFLDPESTRRWKVWAAQTIQWSRGQKKVTLLVDKHNRRALLYESGSKTAEFAVDLGWNRFPAKLQQGDGATPEGMYRVVRKKSGNQTVYFRALLLDYPNETDRRAFTRAKRDGEIGRRARIGAQIEVHGEGGRGRDWTEGCVALANPDMDRIYQLAYVGMPVTIVGEFPE